MSGAMIDRILEAIVDTFYLVLFSGLIGIALGIVTGVALYVTRDGRILSMPLLNRVISLAVNVGRSVPFIILMLALAPFTRWLVGSYIGTTAALVPLSIAAIPFVARLVEGSLNEVPTGLIEAAESMGATPWQIITRVLLPEARGGLITAATITVITLIGYSAMAGAIGAGGLGAVAYNYGYSRYNPLVMLVTVLIMVVMVQGVQMLGDYFVHRTRRR